MHSGASNNVVAVYACVCDASLCPGTDSHKSLLDYMYMVSEKSDPTSTMHVHIVSACTYMYVHVHIVSTYIYVHVHVSV